MNKFILFTILYFANIATANAQITPNFGKGLGSVTGAETGNCIAVDPFGNTYIAGTFSAITDFDPSASTFNLTSNNGNKDVFIAKYNNAGNLLWAKNVGGTGDCRVFDIIADSNYCILVGCFIGTVDFDPSAAIASKTYVGGGTYGDCYFTKLDSAGNYQFVKTIGSSMNDAMKAITLDDNNNIYIAGFVGATADMNPGSGVFNITNTSTFWNTFITKFDPNGNFTYSKHIKGAGSNPFDICLDKNKNIYIAGEFSGTSYFNPLSTTLSLTGSAQSSFYIAKYTNNGLYTNAVRNDGSGTASIQQLKVDNDLNIYVAGFFANTIDFNIGTGSNSYNGGVGSGFAVKYDSAFAYQWTNTVIGTGFNLCYAIELDAANNVYVTGRFSGTNVDFDNSANTAYLSAVNRAAYIAVYNKLGNFLYAGKGSDANGAGNDFAYYNGKMFVIGEFNDSINIGFGATNNSIYSNGSSDVFFASFNVLLSPLAINAVVLQGKSLDNNMNHLTWQVNDIEDVSFFELQASENNTDFTTVATIHPTTTSLSYNYVHNTFGTQNLYYKIQAVTQDNNTVSSNMVYIANTTNNKAIVYLKNNDIVIDNFTSAEKIILVNNVGAVVHQSNNVNNNYTINASNLASGIYYVVVKQIGKTTTHSIVVP